MEHKEQVTLLPWLVLQRFGYRQLMYYIVIKAVLAALLGPLVGWGKLDGNRRSPRLPRAGG